MRITYVPEYFTAQNILSFFSNPTRDDIPYLDLACASTPSPRLLGLASMFRLRLSFGASNRPSCLSFLKLYSLSLSASTTSYEVFEPPHVRILHGVADRLLSNIVSFYAAALSVMMTYDPTNCTNLFRLSVHTSSHSSVCLSIHLYISIFVSILRD